LSKLDDYFNSQLKERNAMELEIGNVMELCEYVYYGMTIKEALALSPIKVLDRSSYDSMAPLMRVLTYVKLKAKYQLMRSAHELATSKIPTINSTRMLQHLVSARCGFSETRWDLKLKLRQHNDLMKFRHENMRNWSDYQSAKMIADASGSQLQDFQRLESKDQG
jgi:hypothetical protein